MRKWSKKKILLGIVGLLVILIAAFYIFINFVYLPGVHIWWRFCSINIERNCYWYDEEKQEFMGDSSAIRIKVTGFRWPKWLSFVNGNQVSDVTGEVEIAGYPVWREGSDDSDSDFTYIYRDDGSWNSLVCWERHSVPGEILLGYGDVCTLYFPLSLPFPEYVMVQVNQKTMDESLASASWEMARLGYVADSLEEAKAMQEYMQKYGISKKP